MEGPMDRVQGFDGFLADEEPSTKVIRGRYIVGHRLGRGAFGSVFRATDLKQDNLAVAIVRTPLSASLP